MCICIYAYLITKSLRWRHNWHDSVSDHQPHHCLFNRLFGCRSTKTSKLRVIGLCAGNSLGTGEFPAQMASNAENASIWWRHHVCNKCYFCTQNIGMQNDRWGEFHQLYNYMNLTIKFIQELYKTFFVLNTLNSLIAVLGYVYFGHK